MIDNLPKLSATGMAKRKKECFNDAAAIKMAKNNGLKTILIFLEWGGRVTYTYMLASILKKWGADEE